MRNFAFLLAWTAACLAFQTDFGKLRAQTLQREQIKQEAESPGLQGEQWSPDAKP